MVTRPPVTDHLIDMAAGGARAAAKARAHDRRTRRRHRYRALVAVVLVSPSGDRGKPVLVRAKDISYTGMRLVSRHMLFPGSVGVVQVVRSDGRMALIGVRVKNCRYVGNMQHHTGLEFIPLPSGFQTEDFIDRNGRMIMLDPMLERNCTRDLNTRPRFGDIGPESHR